MTAVFGAVSSWRSIARSSAGDACPTRPTAAQPRSSPPCPSRQPRRVTVPDRPVMCLRMVSAWQPAATACLASCRAYPRVGHPRAPLLQRAVGLLPAPVPRLRVERVGLAPRRARHVARVGGRRRIDEVANGGGVQDVGAVLEVESGPPGPPPCPRRPASRPRACADPASGAACRRRRARAAASLNRRPGAGSGAGPAARRQTGRAPPRHISIGPRGPS